MSNNDKSTTPTWKLYNRPWYVKFIYGVGDYFKNVGLMIWHVIKNIPFAIWRLICSVGLCFQGLWVGCKKFFAQSQTDR